MKNVVTVVALAAFVVVFSGCASTSQGRKFDDSYVSQIKKGVTTKAQIRQHFGEPVSVTTSSENEAWTYSYSDAYGRAYIQAATYGLVREKSDDQMLIVVFSGDKVVEYTYTK